MLPINQTKVLDKTLDVYLWINEELNTSEVVAVGLHLIDLANRRATDVEMYYLQSRYPEIAEYTLEDFELSDDQTPTL